MTEDEVSKMTTCNMPYVNDPKDLYVAFSWYNFQN